MILKKLIKYKILDFCIENLFKNICKNILHSNPNRKLKPGERFETIECFELGVCFVYKYKDCEVVSSNLDYKNCYILSYKYIILPYWHNEAVYFHTKKIKELKDFFKTNLKQYDNAEYHSNLYEEKLYSSLVIKKTLFDTYKKDFYKFIEPKDLRIEKDKTNLYKFTEYT